ncbi:MAG: Na+/H+ antiporter subunit E [Cyclobacteriaceae bacterium]|nr:Na+/H+ antiporter subunit E [Cyclobacteriaceae bacterium]MCH8516420.1 Na+/H+ antiporter subunit E [Cyclobacteriaceae bacterium]
MLKYLFNLIVPIVAVYYALSLLDGVESNLINSTGLFVGFYLIMWLSSFLYSKTHFYQVIRIASFTVYFFKELFIATLRVAYDIVTPNTYITPSVLAIPMDAETDVEITLLASFITLTPGTLSIDVSDDNKFLYVHTLYLEGDDPEQVKRSIKEGFERRILEITRAKD